MLGYECMISFGAKVSKRDFDTFVKRKKDEGFSEDQSEEIFKENYINENYNSLIEELNDLYKKVGLNKQVEKAEKYNLEHLFKEINQKELDEEQAISKLIKANELANKLIESGEVQISCRM